MNVIGLNQDFHNFLMVAAVLPHSDSVCYCRWLGSGLFWMKHVLWHWRLQIYNYIYLTSSLTLRRVLLNANAPLLNCFWIAPNPSSRNFCWILKTVYVWEHCVVWVQNVTWASGRIHDLVSRACQHWKVWWSHVVICVAENMAIDTWYVLSVMYVASHTSPCSSLILLRNSQAMLCFKGSPLVFLWHL